MTAPVAHFIFRVSLFLFLQTAVAVSLVAPATWRGQEGYMASTCDKHARLDFLRGRPRLIIAGGSSAAFGLDSRAIEQATGREVVNLSIHAGLGQHYILAEAESSVEPGDELWLAAEFDLIWSEPSLNDLHWDVILARPAAWRDLRLVPMKTLLDQGAFQLLGFVVREACRWMLAGTRDSLGLYTRLAFNERGDVVKHARLKPPRPVNGLHDKKPISEASFRAGMERLRDVVRRCEAKGVTVRIVLPPLHEEAVRRIRPVLERVVAELERRFPGKVIGTMGDVAVQDDWCFDTTMHLTREAARVRTRILLDRAGYPITDIGTPGVSGPKPR